MEQLIVELATKYPVIATVFVVIGILRLVVKPLMALIQNVVIATPSKKDDEIFVKVEASPITKGILWFLDWTTSIKLPGAPGTVQPKV